MTTIGRAVGTWKYAAPERFIDEESTLSVDVYALACVLHECLTGSPPYRADSADMLITAHLIHDIPHPGRGLRPEIPTAFDAVIARGMAKDPKARYASAGELAQAASDALSARDQHRAEDIVERGEEATLPEAASDPPAPAPATSSHLSGTPPGHQARNFEAPPPVIPPLQGAAPAAGGEVHSLPTPWSDWHRQFGETPLGLSPYQRPRIRRGTPKGTLIVAAIAAVSHCWRPDRLANALTVPSRRAPARPHRHRFNPRPPRRRCPRPPRPSPKRGY